MSNHEVVAPSLTPGNRNTEPQGVLRVALPDSYGRACIMPHMAGFLARYPKVTLDIRFIDEVLDMVEQGVEVGIRIGELRSSTLIAGALGTVEHLLVATPDYLSSRGMPDNPGGLIHHACILYTGKSHAQRWVFESEYGREVVDVSGRILVNSADAMYQAVRQHLGIAIVPDWIIGDDLKRGIVHRLLPEHYPLSFPIRIDYPQARVLSLRARSFIDFLMEQQEPAA